MGFLIKHLIMRHLVLSSVLLVIVGHIQLHQCSSIQQRHESNSRQASEIHSESHTSPLYRIEREDHIESTNVHHRETRGAKRKNIFRSILRNPSLTRALIKTKNNLSNRLGKRKSKRKQAQRDQKPKRSKPKNKIKGQRGNRGGSVRGIIQDILHKPKRQN